MERKLAVILVADIVGYSAQMERDEAGTYARVTARRLEVFEPEITRHKGRIFKLVGDGLLAEFGSAVQAVECAIAVQSSLAERNRDVPDDQRIVARIGINLGEVIVEGDDRLGEGVNIAARLEQLADPGGICVSEKVAREVERKLAFGFVSMGERRVKNIAEPIHVYRVSADTSLGVRRAVGKPGPKHRLRWMLAVAAALVLGMGALTYWVTASVPTPSGPPALAILPYKNMTDDPAQDYVGAAIAEEIITLLSTSPLLQVAARSASYELSPTATPKQVARELGVDYILEGSFRQRGEMYSISSNLVDVRNGRNIWASNLAVDGTDLSALQDSIARKTYATIAGLNGKVPAFEVGLSWTKLGPALGEYDYSLRGSAEYLSETEQGLKKAEQIWTEGLTEFPDSALLRLALAELYRTKAVEGPSGDPAKDIETSWRLLQEAEAIADPSRLEQWLLHFTKALALPVATGDFEGSVREAEAAHAMVPHDPVTTIELSRAMANAGRGDTAVAWAESAIDNDQEASDRFRDALAWAYWAAGRPEDAVQIYDTLSWRCIPCHISSLVRVGRLDDARKLAAWDHERRPDWTLEDERFWPSDKFPFMVDSLMGPYLDDLRTAGLE